MKYLPQTQKGQYVALEYEEVEVTPEIAQQYLATMTVNRRVSRSNLEALVLAMNEGRWHQDGSPIKFNTKGNLVDGQHRMWAVITSDIPQKFLVIRNVPDDAMYTLDTGKSRSRSDVLTIHDPSIKDPHNVAAATTIILRWKKGVRYNNLRNEYVSNDEVVRFYDEHGDAIKAASKVGRRIASHIGGVTAQAASLCAYLFESIDPEDAEYFWDRLFDGSGLAADSPILILREYLQREARTSRQTVRADVSAAIIIKAWNAYREGRGISLLRFRIGGANPEMYPEPV